ncbi:MAG: acyltransferase family protein [Clostridia bacterium]|nr:acyltransferase family protein [Clostridia bacterium]
MTEKNTAVREENFVFRALYLIAIIFVVDGHTTLADMFSIGNLFRYYSFHLMLFAFGAGYFFRMKESIAQDILSRARRLLVPLYIWNVVYGVGAAFLRRYGGFEIGQPLSAYTLLLAPIVDGEQFVWNLGAWFLFPLFLTQVFYSLLRRAAALWKDSEPVTFVLCLTAGCSAVTLCHAGMQDTLPLFLMRTLILLPGYAGGQLYRRCLEKRDTMKTVPYLLIIVILRALLCVRYENLAYLLSNCTYFVCDAFGVYFGGALAIAFYLRIACLIAPLMKKSPLALYASRHTFDIMMHHFMGFFALNSVFLVFNALGVGAADFSVKSMRTIADYNYAPYGREEWNILYLIAGMLLPLCVAWATDHIKNKINKIKKRAK